ncbi:MAG: hypothetical protein HY873_06540 [Chloroflexi bacterium]|nr:hypothetical protein [Chloroflexota bacterium]
MNQLQRLTPRLANDDPEFALAARMWDGDVLFACGEDAMRMTVRGGRVTEIVEASPSAQAAIRIIATADDWEKLLQPVPPPFYQDLFGAASRHGVLLLGEPEVVFPYYPALRRLIELLRTSGGGR